MWCKQNAIDETFAGYILILTKILKGDETVYATDEVTAP